MNRGRVVASGTTEELEKGLKKAREVYVVVGSPELAKLLRKAGVFSGKTVKGPVPDDLVVERDLTGAAIGATVTGGARHRRQ